MLVLLEEFQEYDSEDANANPQFDVEH